METGNTQNDDIFVSKVNRFIDEELRLIEQHVSTYDRRNRFLIFKEALNKIIEYAQIYRNLLIDIKKGYEYCIDVFENQNVDVKEKIDELLKYKSYPETISNLKKSKLEFLQKFDKTKFYTQELEQKLESLIEKNEKFRPKKNTNKFEFLIAKEKKESDQEENKKIVISGLSLDKTTDLVHLDFLLKEVEYKIKELSVAQAEKYSNKQQKKDLEIHLIEKIKVRDEKKIESYAIKNKLQLYKLVIGVAKDYYDNKTQYSSLQDALSRCVIGTLMRQYNQNDDELDNSDDFGLEQEAEIILDHIEKFNDLFENGKYIDAAYFAVASPKNILSNIETLYRFKNISEKIEMDAKTDPLMVYCEAMIDSASSNFKPDEAISLECIKIALKYNKLEALSRWIAFRKLTFSIEAGKYIEEYSKFNFKNPKSSIELALFVYNECNAISRVALCLAKLGRYTAMFDLILKDKEMHNNIQDWLKIFKNSPSIEFANMIVENLVIFINHTLLPILNETIKSKENNPVPIDQIVSILLDSDQPENGLKFLKDQIWKISKDETKKEEINKLKTSYETLVKFSFLAQDEEQFTKETAIKSRDQFQNLYSLRSRKKTPRTNPTKNKLRETIQEPLIEESIELIKAEKQNINQNVLQEEEEPNE